jgi:hypothetical protein
LTARAVRHRVVNFHGIYTERYMLDNNMSIAFGAMRTMGVRRIVGFVGC